MVEHLLIRMDTKTIPPTAYIVDNHTGEGEYPSTTTYDHDGTNGEPLTSEEYGLFYLVKID